MDPATLDRRTTPARPDLAAETLRGLVAASRYVAGTPMRVIAAVAPLRRRPAPDAPLDTQALMGEAVTVYDEAEGWAWAQLEADGYVGYLPSGALSATAPAPTHRVAVLRTFVHPGPDLKLPPRDHLSLGAGVAVLRRDGDWARLPDGGAVFAAHLAPLDAAEPDYVGVAERFRGTPYLWGGKTSLGLDCSGLVQLALAAAGIAAPRDSDLQAALGAPVAPGPGLAGLARGDLVFWKGHVGIMRDETRLLHANGHHMLTVSEPLAEVERRVREGGGGGITGVRRVAGVEGGKPS